MGELLLAYTFFFLLASGGTPTTQASGGWWPTMPFAEHTTLWEIFGFIGIGTFGSRFVLQWLHSEKHGESRVPPSFWHQSLVGTLILTCYFIYKREIVGLSGYVVNIVPYTRNIMLIQKQKKIAIAKAASGASDAALTAKD